MFGFVKQFFGIILFFAYLALYILGAMYLGTLLGTSSQILMLIFYVVAGAAWVWPAKKILRIIR